MPSKPGFRPALVQRFILYEDALLEGSEARQPRPPNRVRQVHLRRVLKTYASYYKKLRTHLSLDKDTPHFRRVLALGNVTVTPILGGLHHYYLRV